MRMSKCAAISGALLVALLTVIGGCSLIPSPPPTLPAGAILSAPTSEPGGPSYAHILFVRAVEETEGTWRFEVTVQHPDEGEHHYADQWEILIPLPDGQTQQYIRKLDHPHIEEQPFTRSLAGIKIPAGVTVMTVRAHDSRDGYGGQEVTLDLAALAGPGFQVVRR